MPRPFAVWQSVDSNWRLDNSALTRFNLNAVSSSRSSSSSSSRSSSRSTSSVAASALFSCHRIIIPLRRFLLFFSFATLLLCVSLISFRYEFSSFSFSFSFFILLFLCACHKWFIKFYTLVHKGNRLLHFPHCTLTIS